MLAGLFLIGTAAAGAAEKIVDRGDPGLVVIDEILGQLIALALVPWHPVAALAGFALFRFFDITKIWPVCRLEKLPAGWGILADDLWAGLYAMVVLTLGIHWIAL